MWSKTKKQLEDRLADCLKKRVYYSYDVFDTFRKGGHWGCEMNVFYIRVDKKSWFASNDQFYNSAHRFNKEKYVLSEQACLDAIHTDGFVPTGNCDEYDVMKYIHYYLNELSFDEALCNDNYFIRLLAILDRRLGKRRLKDIAENIGNEPEWFRKWIRLRCEGEGII